MQTWIEHVPLMRDGYHETLLAKVAEMRESQTIYPPQERVLYALDMTPFNEVQIVILGQDPYHGEGQAHGLAFSVPEGVTAPPSLRNIFKEIVQDVYNGEPRDFSPDLTRWAKQGVLLLNAILTVEAGQAASHHKLGWQKLTDQIVAQLSQERAHLVCMLWGRKAQAKTKVLDPEKHLILEAPHPSPLSARRGFFGCAHFSKANEYLRQHGGTDIVW